MVPAPDAELERADAEISVQLARHEDHEGDPVGNGAGEERFVFSPRSFINCYVLLFLSFFVFVSCALCSLMKKSDILMLERSISYVDADECRDTNIADFDFGPRAFAPASPFPSHLSDEARACGYEQGAGHASAGGYWLRSGRAHGSVYPDVLDRLPQASVGLRPLAQAVVPCIIWLGGTGMSSQRVVQMEGKPLERRGVVAARAVGAT